MAPVDPSRPDLFPVPLPVHVLLVPPNPSAADLTALSCWWDEDNAAQHILTAKIGLFPRGLPILSQEQLYPFIRNLFITTVHADILILQSFSIRCTALLVNLVVYRNLFPNGILVFLTSA